jgi:hypothetical protein
VSPEDRNHKFVGTLQAHIALAELGAVASPVGIKVAVNAQDGCGLFHVSDATAGYLRSRWIGMTTRQQRKRNDRLVAALVLFLTSVLLALAGADVNGYPEPLTHSDTIQSARPTEVPNGDRFPVVLGDSEHG